VAWAECDETTETFAVRVAEAETLVPFVEVSASLYYRYQNITDLRFSPDERFLAFAGHSGQTMVGVADLEAGAILWRGGGAGAMIPWGLAFSLDSTRLFVTNLTGVLACCESSSGRTIWADYVECPFWVLPWKRVLASERLRALAISPDGRLVAASTDYNPEVIVWEAASGKRMSTLDLSDYPIEQALFFDPSGEGLWAAGALDTELRYFPIDLDSR
jgi:WD40 repeat protein